MKLGQPFRKQTRDDHIDMRAHPLVFKQPQRACRVRDREVQKHKSKRGRLQRRIGASRESEVMVSREHKRAAALHEKLQLLRSITNSHAETDTSIIADASKYIVDLKEKVERLNQDIVGADGQSSASKDSLPKVTVETLEKGFLINVYSEKSCSGLLVSVLEAFEELNLNVVEARASCTENFQLEAVSVEGDDQGGENVDAQVVRQAVLQAIRHWRPIA